jgi:hypothetical protein
MFLDHTQPRTTARRTPLDEWSARRKSLYLTTHDNQQKYPCPRWDSNHRSQQTSGLRPLICYLLRSWNYPPNGPQCMSINMSTFSVSFHTMAVKLHLTLVLSPLFKLILCPKFFSIPFLFGLTVLHQFIVSVCKLPDGDENKLSMYNLCRSFSILAINSVTVACVAVMEGVTSFLSLFTAVFIAL